MAIELCRERDFFFGHDVGVSGEAAIGVEWQVFDPLERRILHRTFSRGWAMRDSPAPGGDDLLLQDAFAAAVVNLAADQGFRELLIAAGRPSRLFQAPAAPPEGGLLPGTPVGPAVAEPAARPAEPATRRTGRSRE